MIEASQSLRAYLPITLALKYPLSTFASKLNFHVFFTISCVSTICSGWVALDSADVYPSVSTSAAYCLNV